MKIAIDLGRMVLRRRIAFYRTLIWVLELEIMSFSCKFWPKKQYFCCFRLIFCVYRWNLKFCSSRIVEAVKKYFVLNFEVNLIRRFWDWSVLISISRLLYFCITCFFVVCTSITSWIIFLNEGASPTVRPWKLHFFVFYEASSCYMVTS